MTRRVRVLIAALVLAVCVLAAIPLIQRLSVELMELQVSHRLLDDRLTLPEVARNFDVPLDPLAADLGLGSVPKRDLEKLPLSALARLRGQPLQRFKRDLVRTAFESQLRGTPFGRQPKAR